VRKFLDRLVKIKAYDPEAADGAMAALEGRIEICKNGYDALEGADALVILTDWQEFRNPDLATIAAKLKKPVIFDGRNLYDPGVVKAAGIEYHSVGRATV
jgi:UDPglucose 6-dehydrogenase